jgi:hypothetical protein
MVRKVPMFYLKNRNERTGKHFFDKDTMRFFDSKLPRNAYISDDDKTGYFISSEQFHGPEGSAPRKYSVRKMDLETGSVDSIDDFQQFPDYKSAQKKLKEVCKKCGGSI